MTERLHFHFSLSCLGEGNGNPLQCSCLENPRGWWSLVGCRLWGCKSWTRLKRLSSSSSSNTFVPHYDSWLSALSLYKPLDSSLGWVAVLEAWANCVPLSASWELKPHFYCFQTLAPHFLFSFSGQRKPKFWPATTWKQTGKGMSDLRLWLFGFTQVVLGLSLRWSNV